MIILDIRLKQDLSKIEFLKIFLHALKICLLFKFMFVIQSNSRTFKLKSFTKKIFITPNIKLAIILNSLFKAILSIILISNPQSRKKEVFEQEIHQNY